MSFNLREAELVYTSLSKILVVAAHPDDETLGAGGTIAKLSRLGKSVHLCIVTKPYPPDWSEEIIEIKRKEVQNAAKILKIKEVTFFGFPTAKLDSILIKELADKFTELIWKLKPEMLFLPFVGDMSQDHRAVFNALSIAAKPIPSQPIRKIVSYEAPSSTEYSFNRFHYNFTPNLYVDISKEIKVKLNALKSYKTELKEFPHPRSIKGVITRAKLRGSEVGLKMAEAFLILRWVVS